MLALSLGGLNVRLHEKDASATDGFETWFRPYRTTAEDADLHLSVDGTLTAPTGADARPRIRCSGAPGHRRYAVLRRDLEGWIDEATRKGEFRHEPTYQSLGTVLKAALSVVLPPAGGLIVHASAALRRGRGFIFPGVSGAGKSTLLRVSGGAPELSDETAVLTRAASEFEVHGTPFHGELAVAQTAAHGPLACMAFPDRTFSPGAHRLPAADALGRLLRCVVNYCDDDPCLDRQLLASSVDLVRSVPAFAVSLRPDEPVWDALPAELTA